MPQSLSYDNDSTTLVSQGDSLEEVSRHGFEHDEQFLTMLQQVYFMYYNVRGASFTASMDRFVDGVRTSDMSPVVTPGKIRRLCLTGACASE